MTTETHTMHPVYRQLLLTVLAERDNPAEALGFLADWLEDQGNAAVPLLRQSHGVSVRTVNQSGRHSVSIWPGDTDPAVTQDASICLSILECDLDTVANECLRVYAGLHTNAGWRVVVNGQEFNAAASRRIFDHQPIYHADGFRWGSTRGGDAQLALAILFDATTDAQIAREYHQRFLADVVSRWPQDAGWTFDSFEVRAWLERARKGETP